MENVYVFGVSWRQSSAERIEDYTLAVEGREERIASLRDVLGLSELCYLATCNRVELSCVLSPRQNVDDIREGIYRELGVGSNPLDARREIKIWGGEGAAEHLFLLAAGLDSAQVGEQEIAGQLRRAIESAREAGTLGPQLLWLFQQVLKVSKMVQTESGLRQGRISLAEIAVQFIQEALGEYTGPVALVGVSKMTERCAESLQNEDVELLFVNRTISRARALAEKFGGRALDLDTFTKKPPTIRALVSATNSAHPLFSGDELGRIAESCSSFNGSYRPTPLLIDLAVPADIEATAAKAQGFRRIDMNEINATAAKNSKKRAAEKARARVLVDTALEKLQSKVAGRALSPLIGELYNVYRETASQGLDRELGKRVKDLSAEQEAAVREFAEELARRLAHIPAVGLRALAAESGIDPVRTFLAASKDPMTARLSELAERNNEAIVEGNG